MSEADIHKFFDRYVDAFNHADVAAVVSLWSLPAIISTAERGPVGFTKEDEFRRNTEALCAFYARQGLARAEKQVLSVQHLSSKTASVKTADRLYDCTGSLIVDWEHGYLLQERSGEITAFAAVADGEVAAWAARGTPLGS